MNKMIEDKLLSEFFNNDKINKEFKLINNKVLNGEILPTEGAERLLSLYKSFR